MELQFAEQDLINSLAKLYATPEAEVITDWIMEDVTGLSKLYRRRNNSTLNTTQTAILERYKVALMQYVPVQYVLNKAYFYGMQLYVNEHVLIPRPETEELALWAIEWARNKNRLIQVLDIGTGSGCLAIAIRKEIKLSEVCALDFSEEALKVVEKNAKLLKLTLRTQHINFLEEHMWNQLSHFDLLISNPPYITPQEMAVMEPNVLLHEPYSALFVTDNDPLQFYKKIEKFARQKLNNEGVIFLELHQAFALETQAYYQHLGWKTELRKDLNNNARMLFCQR